MKGSYLCYVMPVIAFGDLAGISRPAFAERSQKVLRLLVYFYSVTCSKWILKSFF